jgi:MraZ protein
MLADGGSGSKPKLIFGYDEATIDGKGRLLIAKRKRDWLGDSFVVMLGETGCLSVYRTPEWETLVEQVMSIPSLNQGRQQYTRLMLANSAGDLTCDAQGRVVVPQSLRDLAKLGNEVVVIGCADHLEIWNRSEWLRYNEYPDSYNEQRQKAISNAYTLMAGQGQA